MRFVDYYERVKVETAAYAKASLLFERTNLNTNRAVKFRKVIYILPRQVNYVLSCFTTLPY